MTLHPSQAVRVQPSQAEKNRAAQAAKASIHYTAPRETPLRCLGKRLFHGEQREDFGAKHGKNTGGTASKRRERKLKPQRKVQSVFTFWHKNRVENY